MLNPTTQSNEKIHQEFAVNSSLKQQKIILQIAKLFTILLLISEFFAYINGTRVGEYQIHTIILLALLIFFGDLMLLCRFIVNEKQESANHNSAVEHHETHYRAVVEQSEEGIAIIERGTMRVIESNKAFASLLGYESVEDLKSLTAHDFNADKNWRDKYLIRQKGSQKTYYSGEKNYRSRSGKLIPVEVNTNLISYDNNHVYCINVKDITERKRAEEELKRLAIVAQKTQNAVIITDSEGCIQWVNEGFTVLTGYKYEEVVGNLGYLLQGKETNAEMVEAIRAKMLTRQPFCGEIYSYTKDGTGFWMSISITPTYSEKGEVQGFVAVQMDITERKAMEEQLRRAQSELESRVVRRTAALLEANQALEIENCERKRAETKLKETQQFLRKVIDSVPNMIFVKDSEGRFMLANKSLADMYGITTGEIIGKTDADFSKDIERIKQVAADEQHVMENLEEKFIYEEKFTDVNGNSHWLQTVKRPLVLGDGGLRHVLCIATDLTDRKILENKLRHSQKMESIGQLAAGIAHEINTPTQYVSDNAFFIRDSFADVGKVLFNCRELIEKITSDDWDLDLDLVRRVEAQFDDNDIEYLIEEIPKSIEQALEGVSRISKIVCSMRTFAHPGAIEMKPSDINKAIESTVAVAHNEWKYVADLETVFDENLPLVPCLLDEFNQVILNMIINATHSIADAGSERNSHKGKITITTKQADNQWAEIRIADTGGGIPCEYQNRIFDPFFTTKEVGKGTGQGLAISHNVIVEKHKGHLSFETEPNNGTTFIIRLPLEKNYPSNL